MENMDRDLDAAQYSCDATCSSKTGQPVSVTSASGTRHFQPSILRHASTTTAFQHNASTFRSYADYVEHLAQDHLHLECLSNFLKSRMPGQVRQNATPSSEEVDWVRQRMMILDVFHNDDEHASPQLGRGSKTLVQHFPTSRGDTGFLESVLRNPAPNIRARTIVVEVPTPENICLLGEMFDIDPTFFYNHLETQAWAYRGWSNTKGAPDYLTTRANPLRKKRFLHLDVERLHVIHVEEHSIDSEKFAHLLKGFIRGLSQRIAVEMDIVPKMKMVRAGRLNVREGAHFVTRNRISLYNCEQSGVKISIYLLYPSVASRKYQFSSSLVPAENDNRIHSVSPQPLPKYSRGRSFQYETSARTGTFSRRLLYLLQNWYRFQDSAAADNITPISCLFSLISSEWVMTLGHIHYLMGRFERDSNLLAPSDEKPHNISLFEVRHLIYEYRDMVTGTLRLLRQQQPYNDDDDEVLEDFEAHRATIETLLERADKAIASHTGFMAIEESRKAIAETEAVRRLTNLAFIFLPLSLTTGIYGMNVKEFKGAVNLWIVGVTGATLTTLAVAAAIHWSVVRWVIYAVWFAMIWPWVMARRAVSFWWVVRPWKKAVFPYKGKDSGLRFKEPREPVVGLRAFLREKGL
ncbi:hypothetical protein BDD12DRAFT_865656 [Trichophaea hybrida]|nr:hypothetical protein BDD12DRAFT_865656 [Trichophaea hybrida]